MDSKPELPGRTVTVELLAEEVFIAERKIIRLGHYKNRRGEYLQVKEVTDNGYNSVIVPFTATLEFYKRLGKLLKLESTPLA